MEPHRPIILLQILVALAVMVWGARVFVHSIEVISLKFGLNPLLFALILAPIATELPEKFNSVSWTLKGKDSLAIGNVTGAMVFQATFPVSVGLLFTEWHVTGNALLSAIIALTSATIVLVQLKTQKKLSPITLSMGGLLYLIYIVVLINPFR
jgi:cation:H+ antiporter